MPGCEPAAHLSLKQMKPKLMNILQARSPAWGQPRRLALFLALCAPGAASAATISGTVYDADNDFYMEGAVIRIEETGRRTTSGRGGTYRLADVDEGTYVVVVEPLQYPPSRRTVVVEASDDEITADFTLSIGDAFELEALTVEGQAVAQAKSISLRRSSAELKEIVSTDAFGQFADRNPAEALQRTAGVTVQDGGQGQGEFVIIRGTSPDLSSVQIDGVSLATPSEDGRQTNLNIITVDQLERIELSKTWLPEHKANVVGGTVNMITRSALDRGRMFASIEGAFTERDIADDTSWRSSATFGGVLDEKNAEWLGDKAIGLQVSVNQSEDFLGSDTISWSWTGDRDFPYLNNPGEDQPRGFSLVGVNRRNYNIDRERFGGSAKLEFRLNGDHEFFVSFNQNKFDDTEREHQFYNSANNQSQQFYSGTVNLTEGIVEQLGLDPADPFVVDRLARANNDARKALTYGEAEALGEIAYDPETNMFTRGGRWPMNLHRTYIHTEREDRIDTFQIGGQHRLWWETEMDWTAYVSEATQDQERHWLRFTGSSSGSGGVPMAGPGLANPYVLEAGAGENPLLYNKRSFRRRQPTTANTGGMIRQHDFMDTSDERRGFDLDLQKKGYWGNFTLTTQAGVSVEQRDKDYHVDNNDYGLAGDTSLDPELWPNQQMSLEDELFDGGEIDGFEENFGSNLRFGPSFAEDNTLAFLRNPEAYGVQFAQTAQMENNNFIDRVQQNYDASEDVMGAYLQQTVEWGDWTVIAGVRYERTENTFTNLDIVTRHEDPDFPLPFINPLRWRVLRDSEEWGGENAYSAEVTHERDYDEFHPALHVIRRIGDNTQIRAAVSQTLARPKFTDLVPREIPSTTGDNDFGTSVQMAAFDLEPMESTNYDLSLDHYFAPIGMFSVALFHKELDGPIYTEVRRGVGPNEETAAYAERYMADGLNDSSWNLTRRRNAGDGKLSGIEVTFDRKLSFLPSFWDGFGVNSNIAWFDSEATLLTEERQGETVSLFQQPDMTANASIYYDKHGIFARLSYNLRGEYLHSIEGGSQQAQEARSIGTTLAAYDTWIGETHRVDLTLRYKITPQLQVFFDAINLTNEPTVRFMGSEVRPLQKQYTERVFTVGLKWSL